MDKFILHRLDEASIEKARVELNEDASERDGAIQTFRSWILEQKWLKTPTDDSFLLMFLRARKFSQLAARELLENFWKLVKNIHPDWFHNLDPSDPEIQHVLDTESFLILPGKDKNGRSVILRRPSKYDEDHMDAVIKLVWCCVFYCYLDEKTQVNGHVLFGDLTHFTPSYGLDKMKAVTTALKNNFPGRVKGIHLYNHGPLFELAFNVIKPFLKEKLKLRIQMHGNSLVGIYDEIDMSILPKEYLPDEYVGPCAGTIKDLIEYTKRELSRPELKAFLKYLQSEEYGVDESLKPKDVPAESFRQLKVD